MTVWKSKEELRYLISQNKIDEVLPYLKDFFTLIDAKGIISKFDGFINDINNPELDPRRKNKIKNETLEYIRKYANKIDNVLIPEWDNFNGTYHIMAELAQELAANYHLVSFGAQYDDLFDQRIKTIFENGTLQRENKDSKRRNILVIGAGATHNSCPYVPFGKKLREYISNDEKYKYLVERSEVDISYPRTPGKFNPETYLGHIYDDLGKKDKLKLRDFLHTVFNARYLPTYTYELIAHMFKHSFFDVIINFNFDELLDEAIDEELGPQNYIKVIHDSDCNLVDDIMIDNRLKTPIYIKIHGTASDKSTLKFTDGQHRMVLSEEIQNYIRKWIRGQMGEGNEAERIKVNMICMGMDPERAGFYRHFRDDVLPEGSKWFHINWTHCPPMEDYGLKKYYACLPVNKVPFNRHIQLSTWKNQWNPHAPEMGDWLLTLWYKFIIPLFKPEYAPRSVARHEVIADIFYLGFEHLSPSKFNGNTEIDAKYKELKEYFRTTRYFFERTLVEVGISLIRNKGVIEPREISKERIGYFYNLYKKHLISDADEAARSGTSLAIDKKDGKDFEKRLFSLEEIYQRFRLNSDFSFSENLCNLAPFDPEKDKWKIRDVKFLRVIGLPVPEDQDEENVIVASVLEALNKPENEHFLIMYRFYKQSNDTYIFNNLFKLRRDQGYKFILLARLADRLNRIRKGFTYDIKPRFRDENYSTFSSIRRKHILNTDLALTYQFWQFTREGDWDIMLLISERGKFLTSKIERIENDIELIELRKKKIVIINCHEAVIEHLNLTKLYSQDPNDMLRLKEEVYRQYNAKNLNIQIQFLPYWRHHHHMALFLKKMENPLTGHKCFCPNNGQYLIPVRAIYYFKQGFSNRINPVSLPTFAQNKGEITFICKDQEFLLETFYAHYVKSLCYEKTGKYIPVIKPDLTFNFSDFPKLREQIHGHENFTFEMFLRHLYNGDLPT